MKMLAEPTGEIGTPLELQDRVAKKGSGRVIPIHPDLHAALVRRKAPASTDVFKQNIKIAAAFERYTALRYRREDLQMMRRFKTAARRAKTKWHFSSN